MENDDINTIIQTFVVCNFSFLKEMNTFIQQGCITLIKRDSKDIHDVLKILLQRNVVLLRILFIKEF